MITYCFPRQLVCCIHLSQVCDLLVEGLKSVGGFFQNDAGPHDKSLPSFVEPLTNVLSDAEARLQIKSQQSAVDEWEEESEEILKLYSQIAGTLVHIRKRLEEVPEKISEEWKSEFRYAIKTYESDLRRCGEDSEKILKDLSNRFSLPDYSRISKKDWAILSIDLSRYGYISSALELDELFRLNREINDSIERSLYEIECNPLNARIINTGDGALLFLEDLNEAVRFSFHFRKLWAQKNKDIAHKKFSRQFRIGITRGTVAMRDTPPWRTTIPGAEAASYSIGIAARLQGSKMLEIGDIAMDESVFDQVEETFQPMFIKSVEFDFKKHEREAKGLIALPSKAMVAPFSERVV